MITLSRAKELSAAVIKAQDDLNRALNAASSEGMQCFMHVHEDKCLGYEADNIRIEVTTYVDASKMEAE